MKSCGDILGEELLEVLRLQRQTFIRTADGGKIFSSMSDRRLYEQCEDEALELQKKIGRDNYKNLPPRLKESIDLCGELREKCKHDPSERDCKKCLKEFREAKTS